MAVTVTAAELAGALAGSDAPTKEELRAAGNLLTFAAEVFRHYLGGAARLAVVPDTICNNAVARLAGYFRDAPAVSSRILSNTRASGMERGQRPIEYPYEWSVDHDQATAHALRQSGAMALLSPYLERRAL